MKERLITLALAIGALLLFYALFIPKPAAENKVSVRPLSSVKDAVGYQGLWLWLTHEHVAVTALHQRYDLLPHGQFDGVGNVLVTTLPHKLPVHPREGAQLDAWIERGNTLVVAAAFDDTPEWTLGDDSLPAEAGRLTRLKFSVVNEEKPAAKRSFGAVLNAVAAARTVTLVPRGQHPLMDGVGSLTVDSEFPASRWRASPMDSAGVLEIGQVAENHDGAVWVRRQGKGEVIVFAVAGLFSNRALQNPGNAKLFANLLAWRLGPSGRVIFDDVHQGAVGYYDAKAFFNAILEYANLCTTSIQYYFFATFYHLALFSI